jgi:acetyl esterase/lipase
MTMKSLAILLPFLLLLAGCGLQGSGRSKRTELLPDARRGFQTKLVRQVAANQPVEEPPAEFFRSVRYKSPAGDLAAYVSQPPQDGMKHPAIIWIFGGFSNGIGATAWEESPPENDQSASAFRKAGIVMMYPSLRGGVDNPGFQEGFFGEVDDVLAAADYLAQQEFVDPKRIYLGGHSTGGTLALLVAASTDRFRAVISFGPVDDVGGYGTEVLPFDTSNDQEFDLRAPILWMHSIRCPTFVLEGTGQPGNFDAVRALDRASSNPLVQVHMVKGADHFSILAPATRLIAEKIIRDDGPTTNLAISEDELKALFGR